MCDERGGGPTVVKIMEEEILSASKQGKRQGAPTTKHGEWPMETAAGADGTEGNGQPYRNRVMLPGEFATITHAAGELGELLAETSLFYSRGGLPMRAVFSDCEMKLEP